VGLREEEKRVISPLVSGRVAVIVAESKKDDESARSFHGRGLSDPELGNNDNLQWDGKRGEWVAERIKTARYFEYKPRFPSAAASKWNN
jgi:hypothetical protein